MKTPTMPISLPTTQSALVVWRYPLLARVLHWGLALLIIATTAVGWLMMAIEDQPGSSWYFEQHKSVGIVIAALVLWRIGLRFSYRPASLPTTVPDWQIKLSRVIQFLLYMMMILLPVTGYLGASYSKSGVSFFGWATPRWALADHATAEQYFDIHGTLIWVLIALLVAHVLGALKHLVLDKDGVNQRMWW